MKKIKIEKWVVALWIFLFAACSSDSPAPRTPLDYADWPSTVDGPLEYQIPGHTQAIRRIYINEVGTGMLTTEVAGRVNHEYPNGTIIIKENYTNPGDTEPNNLTVMIKDPEDAQSRGGWVWLNKDYKSGNERIFTNEFCFACHQNANERHPYGDQNTGREFREYVYYPWKPQT